MFVVRLGLFEHFLYVRSPFGAIKAIIWAIIIVVRLGNVITSSGSHQASFHPVWYTRKMTKKPFRKINPELFARYESQFGRHEYLPNGWTYGKSFQSACSIGGHSNSTFAQIFRFWSILDHFGYNWGSVTSQRGSIF